jgi:hypothetical protein
MALLTMAILTMAVLTGYTFYGYTYYGYTYYGCTYYGHAYYGHTYYGHTYYAMAILTMAILTMAILLLWPYLLWPYLLWLSLSQSAYIIGAASVALCGARGDDLRAADFSALTPLRWAASPRSSAWRGGVLTSVTFTELSLCSFDSKSSEKKILSIKYVFLLRSTNVTDRWKCLNKVCIPPSTCMDHKNCLGTVGAGSQAHVRLEHAMETSSIL